MNSKQAEVLSRTVALVEKDHSCYEFKTLQVTEYNHFVAVYAVIGLPEDEGTMASVFGRMTLSWTIGKRGAIVQTVGRKQGKPVYRHWLNTWADAFRKVS